MNGLGETTQLWVDPPPRGRSVQPWAQLAGSLLQREASSLRAQGEEKDRVLAAVLQAGEAERRAAAEAAVEAASAISQRNEAIQKLEQVVCNVSTCILACNV